ncbi:MAG TPA: hypothetical protein PLY87_23560 [Planctomycetaceae bacterium]|nr:hypothetical protein [Planctomycetaceae bacterium]HQZ68097.1 hypothetical protein [Planctomycetaceae bacterium]
MIMQRFDFDGQDDLSEPLMNSEQSGFLYCFVPQNARSRRLRIDHAQTNEIMIQRKAAHDMRSEDCNQVANELHFG